MAIHIIVVAVHRTYCPFRLPCTLLVSVDVYVIYILRYIYTYIYIVYMFIYADTL